LFESREEDGDFSINLKNGKQIKVHSWIIKHHSEMLATMLSANFRERKEKLIQFPPYEDKTVEVFIKFMYGFELSSSGNDVSLETCKELIEMGGVYGVEGIQIAVTGVMEKFLKKENIFKMLQVCKKNNAQEAVDLCVQFVIKNFDKKEMVQSGKIKEFPEIAFKLLENEVGQEQMAFRHCVISVPNKFAKLETEIPQIKTFINHKRIVLAGIGLLLPPSANVNVSVKIARLLGNNEIMNLSTQEVNMGLKESSIPVMFKTPCEIIFSGHFKFEKYELIVSMNGFKIGSFVFMEMLRQWKEKTLVEKTVEGRDISGNFIKDVKFEFDENVAMSKVSDIYFYLQED